MRLSAYTFSRLIAIVTLLLWFASYGVFHIPALLLPHYAALSLVFLFPLATICVLFTTAKPTAGIRAMCWLMGITLGLMLFGLAIGFVFGATAAPTDVLAGYNAAATIRVSAIFGLMFIFIEFVILALLELRTRGSK